jgi:hypothetical protein
MGLFLAHLLMTVMCWQYPAFAGHRKRIASLTKHPQITQNYTNLVERVYKKVEKV